MGASRPTIRGVRRNSANGDVQGEMLEPSLANNPLVRVGSIVAITAVSAKAGGVLLSAKLLAFLHVMCFGMWFGTLAWTSTVFGVVAFRHLPRQMFGSLQSHLFPKYFAVTASMPLLLIGTLYALSGGVPPMHEVRLLAIAAFTAVANIAVAEPRATEVMFERYALEKAAPSERDEARISATEKDVWQMARDQQSFEPFQHRVRCRPRILPRGTSGFLAVAYVNG